MSREIYLDHEYHGAHTVYNVADAVEMEKKGWLRRPSKWTPEKLLGKAAAPKVATEAAAPVAATATPKKRGPKPKA